MSLKQFFGFASDVLQRESDVKPFLHCCSSPRQTANDFMVICNVAKILELVVPLMEHPSETFLATIEEDLMKLIIKHGMTVRCCRSRV